MLTRFLRLCPAMLAFSLVSTAAVHATEMTYTFSGTFTTIRGTGAGMDFLDSFNATYTHNDAISMDHMIEPGRAAYIGGEFTVVAGGKTFSTATTELQILNDYNWSSPQTDMYYVTSSLYDPEGYYLVQFWVWDLSGATLTGLGGPTQEQFEQLGHIGNLAVRRFDSNRTELGNATGYLFGVTRVPDGGSVVVLLGAGLLMLASARRRFLKYTPLLAVGLAVSHSAAKAVTFQFSTTITSVFVHDNATGVNTFVTKGSLNGYSFAVGQEATGRFAYDETNEFGSAPVDPAYFAYIAGKSFSVDVPTSGFHFDARPNGILVLSDSTLQASGWDTFYEEGTNYDGTSSFLGNVWLYDYDGTALIGHALPNNLDLADFEFKQVHMGIQDMETGDQLHFLANVETLRRVPDAGGWSVIILAGVFVGFCRRIFCE